MIVFADCKESFQNDEQTFIKNHENDLEHQLHSRIFWNQKFLDEIQSMYTEHVTDVNQICFP